MKPLISIVYSILGKCPCMYILYMQHKTDVHAIMCWGYCCYPLAVPELASVDLFTLCLNLIASLRGNHVACSCPSVLFLLVTHSWASPEENISLWQLKLSPHSSEILKPHMHIHTFTIKHDTLSPVQKNKQLVFAHVLYDLNLF